MTALGTVSARARGALARLRRRAARDSRSPLSERLAIPKIVSAVADDHPEAFFVEVGSNDGDQHDHLRPFILDRQWAGVMVEPVPYVFERLRGNYGHLDRVILENAAIADVEGEMPFYYLRDAPAEERASLPSWYDGVGSFRKEVVLGHSKHIPDVASRLVETPVRTLTFDTLCESHGVDRVDVLVVDTEGYDWDIIRTIDLDRWSPVLIIYEHFHLSPEDRGACRRHLEAHGYRTMEEGFDTVGLGPRASRRLAEQWGRLRPAIAGVSAQDEAAR